MYNVVFQERSPVPALKKLRPNIGDPSFSLLKQIYGYSLFLRRNWIF